MDLESKILTVSELNMSLKKFMEASYLFKNMWVQGEMSNITYSGTYLYFTLKDSKSVVRCVAYNYAMKGIARDLKEGDQIKVFGNINVYAKAGYYQIDVSELEKTNKIGLLYEKLEKMKKYYFELGYFDESIKKPLPAMPMDIGVVTAHTGAAIKDIINTTHNRNPHVNIYLYSVKVQGAGSATEISRGIEFFNRMKAENQLDVDVLIVGRGGGSIEDLWSFNEGEVIEAIYRSAIPVVSAVGHEIDNLLSDLVADKRAATPTQAAEILIPKLSILQNEVRQKEKMLADKLISKINMMKRELDHKRNNYYIKNFKENVIDAKKMDLMSKEERMTARMLEKIRGMKAELELRRAKLGKYSSKEILKQGYVLVRKGNSFIKRGIEVSKGDQLTIEFQDVKKKVVAK